MKQKIRITREELERVLLDRVCRRECTHHETAGISSNAAYHIPISLILEGEVVEEPELPGEIELAERPFLNELLNEMASDINKIIRYLRARQKEDK